jgi:thiol-disulfide isomerase/thioredoxin
MAALLWIVRHTHSVPGKKDTPHEKARAAVLRDHLSHAKLGLFCLSLMYEEFDPSVVTFLRQVREKSQDKQTRAQATYALAKLLLRRAEQAAFLQKQADDKLLAAFDKLHGAEVVARLKRSNPQRQQKEAEVLFESLSEDKIQAATLLHRGESKATLDNKANRVTLGELAERELFGLRNLLPGKLAPEIVGKDIDGKPMKLSDYRGRVVLLVFCGHWCGPCRALYPLERSLVEKFQGKPFSIVGVNSDSNRDDFKKVQLKEKLTWRWFHDGVNGPIARGWNVTGWPTLYLVDHRGTIVGSLGAMLERSKKGDQMILSKKGNELVERKVLEVESASKK